MDDRMLRFIWKCSAGALASRGNRRGRRFYIFIIRGDLRVMMVRAE